MAVVTEVDVAIVGAGLSGLACARALERGGATVAVLEAAARPGGRVYTASLAGARVDLGARWIAPAHRRVAALCAEAGLALVDQHRAGRAVYAVDDVPRPRLLDRLRDLAGGGAAGALRRLARAAQRDLDALDAITAAAWMARLTPEARRAVALYCEVELAAAPAELSAACLAGHLRAHGGPPSADDAAERWIAGGAAQLVDDLGDRLRGPVHLGARVEAVRERGERVEVVSRDVAVVAGRAVLAVPPPAWRDIAFDPPLDAARARLARGTVMAPIAVVACAYAAPFWRDEALSGEAYHLEGTARAVADVSPPDGPGILAAYVVGDGARRFRADPAEAQAAVVDDLAALFGREAARPQAIAARDWGATRLGGCEAITGPGVLAGARGATRAFGRVHVAGTESAEAFARTMEGAVRAGERAAAELLAGR